MPTVHYVFFCLGDYISLFLSCYKLKGKGGEASGYIRKEEFSKEEKKE